MKQIKRVVSAIVVLAVAWFSKTYLETPKETQGGGTAVAEAPATSSTREVEDWIPSESSAPVAEAPKPRLESRGGGTPVAEVSEIARLFEAQRSDTQVEVEAVVIKTLRDDNVGSRHQKFLLKLEDGHTVLISHNIDLAPRVPLQEGDTVEVYGEYEWNAKGGVIHWTHKDPANRHAHGYILHEGEKYW